MKLVILTPEARRRSRLTTKWSDSKRSYLEIDASSGANSFEIRFLRLPAFQNGAFCQISTPKSAINRDFESITQIRRIRKICINLEPSAIIPQIPGLRGEFHEFYLPLFARKKYNKGKWRVKK